MKDNYVNVWLYVDDREKGKEWREIQEEKFSTNTQPYIYVIKNSGSIEGGLNYSEAKTKLLPLLEKHK